MEKKCPATKVFLVHLRLQERKAVERVTGICRIGSGWYVGRLYAAKNVLARKCCGAAQGPRLESWGVHRMTRRGPGKPCGEESENPVTIRTLCLLKSLSVRPSMNSCRPEESLTLF